MHCFIIGADRDLERGPLTDLATSLVGSPAIATSGLAEIKGDPRFLDSPVSLVLICADGSNAVDAGAATAFAQEQNGRAFVVVLADTIASEDYKRLVRTGSADWIAWRDHPEELRELVGRLGATGAQDRAARIVSFLPSKGGVGNTTLVIETAIRLSTRRKDAALRVAILDLNFQGGTVADALDIEPRFDVGEIMHRPERLDEHLVDMFTSRHSSRLDVFACPMSQIGLNTIRPETVFTFIDFIANRYDAVLFDLPPTWLPWTDNLLRGSDAIVVSGGESVPALRRLKATLGHLDSIGLAEGRIAAVVSAVETDLLGRVARRAVIERTLAGRRTFTVRRDSGGLTEALDVGRPMLEIEPNGRVARDLKHLVGWVEAMADRQAGTSSAAVRTSTP